MSHSMQFKSFLIRKCATNSPNVVCASTISSAAVGVSKAMSDTDDPRLNGSSAKGFSLAGGLLILLPNDGYNKYI